MPVKSRRALDDLCCGVVSQVKSRSAASASWGGQSPKTKSRRTQAGLAKTVVACTSPGDRGATV